MAYLSLFGPLGSYFEASLAYSDIYVIRPLKVLQHILEIFCILGMSVGIATTVTYSSVKY